MHARAAVVVVVVLACSVLVSQAPAFADGEALGWTDGSGVGANTSTSGPALSSAGGGSGGGATSDITCSYVAFDPSQVDFINQNANPSTLNGGSGPASWYNAICTDPNGNIVSVNQFTLPTAPNPADLAQQGFDYNRLPLPAITLNPSLGHPQIVNLPTWLSVSPQTWAPITASAAAGGVAVTTTATPTQVVWSTGDGGTVSCAGPGDVYDVTKPAGDQQTNCSYTYTHSGNYTLTAAVTWSVSWTATGVPVGTPATGALNAATRTASVNVNVTEVGALNQLTG